MLINKKKTCLQIDYAVSAPHIVNMKEREEKDKYLELTRKKCES